MNYEQKYKEALEKVRMILNDRDIALHAKEKFIDIFPELKESEDERIRKWIIDDIRHNMDNETLENSEYKKQAQKALAWLEKQCNQEKQCEQKLVVPFKAKDWYVSKVDGKMHNMTYNPADKVEPKFHPGEWIVDDETPNDVFCVIEVLGEIYKVIDIDGDDYHIPHCKADNQFHLWTIHDAKNGDVLVTTSIRSCPFIYRKTDHNNNLAYYYAGINGNGDFCEGYIKRRLHHFGSVLNVVPATKEQRDTLKRSMTNAGYRWDKEKLKLEKL